MKKFTILLSIFISISIFASANEKLKNITSDQYIKQNPSTERKELVAFVVNQLQDKPKFTQAQIDQELEKFPEIDVVRIQIIEQKIYAKYKDKDLMVNSRAKVLIKFLDELTKKYKINNVDFIMALGDGPENRNLLIPQLAPSAFLGDLNVQKIILVPDFYMIAPKWNKNIIKIKNASNKYTWNDKKNKIFWRGSTTGGIYNLENIAKLPRLSLVIFTSLYPELIDAMFSDFTQISNDKSGEDLKQMLKILPSGKKDRVSKEDHLKYKYLISLDGNTSSWERVEWIMLSNSVLLKQETKNLQWFYSAIKPYIHYVPVNENLEDLFEKLEWMKSHDGELEKISKQAQEFIKNNLMPEDIESHFVLILNEYSKLFEGEKIHATLPSYE